MNRAHLWNCFYLLMPGGLLFAAADDRRRTDSVRRHARAGNSVAPGATRRRERRFFGDFEPSR